MHRVAFTAACLAVATTSTSTRIALAQTVESTTPSAGQLFAEGETLFKQGDFTAAAERFDQAYAIKPHVSAIWNAARAWHRAGEWVKAANRYHLYLKETTIVESDRATATATLTEIAKHVSRIDIYFPKSATFTIDGVPTRETTVYVHPGEHIVEVRDSGIAPKTCFVAANATFQISFAPMDPKPEPPATPPVSPPAPQQPIAKPQPSKTSSSRPLSPMFVVLGGAITGIGAAATIASGIDTLNAKSDFDASPTEDNLDSGKEKQLRTNLLLGATIACGTVTGAIALWFVEWNSPPQNVGVVIMPTSISLQGHF